MAFATVTEIEEHYADAINRAGQNFEAVVELKAEKTTVIADFRLKQVEERERRVWMREAMSEFPLAKSFPQLVVGNTEEKIRESAKQVHEQLSTVFAEHQRNEQMRKLYEAQLAASENPPEEIDESTV